MTIMADSDVMLLPDDDVIIKAGSTEYARFDDGNQRLGIGTDSPTAKLEVRGDSQALAMFSGSSYTIEFDHTGQEKFDLSHGTSGLYFRLANTTLAGVTQNNDFSVFDNSGGQYANFDGSTKRFHIGSNLSTSPSATLDVRCYISASGNLYL